MLFSVLILSYGIGANDETMSTLVGSRTLTLKKALIAGAILSFLGVVFLSEGVSKRIGSNLFSDKVIYSDFLLLSIILSTTIWLIIAASTGAPISTTHTVIGSVLGVALIWAYLNGVPYIATINWQQIEIIVFGWILSPLLGYVIAYALQKLKKHYFRRWIQGRGLKTFEKIENRFQIFLILSVFVIQFSRGGNDSANALGIIYGMVESGELTINDFHLFTIVAAFLFAFGLFTLGRNVIKNVGGNLIEMMPSEAFVITFTTSIILFGCTILGLPVSGGHILIFSIVGSAHAKGEVPDRKSFKKMILSWIITFPIAMLLAIFCYFLLLFLF